MDRDIIIVGGGPSGLSTALHIQRIDPHLAPRVLILEKARYPRPKLCAGGLVIDAEVILERLGLDVSEIPHVDVESIHFDFHARGLEIRMPKRHALRVIRRDEFDTWLAEKAKSRGIEIKESISVKNIIPDKDGVTVETDNGTFHAQVVVGADGSNGITRRCIFPHAPVYTARALEVITPSRSPRNTKYSREAPRGQEEAFFDFFPVPDNIAGYVWDFPTQVHGEPTRCWGIYDTNLLSNEKRPQLKEPLAKEMSRRGFDLDNYELKGHPIRWFSPDNPMSASRVLLVGDAIGADSIFGEGISVALGYGRLAARELKSAFEQNDFSFDRYKTHILMSPLGQALLARWFITYIIYSLKWKWFQVLLWRIMKPIVLVVAWIFVLNWGRRMQKL